MKFSPVIAYGLKIVNNYVVLSNVDITMTTTNIKKMVLVKADFCVIYRPATENPKLGT